jgi:hypothetical protein
MKINRSLGMLIIVGGGFLMLIDTLLAWQSVTVNNLTYSRNAWHGFWGIILGLMSVAFLASAISHAKIIEFKFRFPDRYLMIILGPAILVFSVIKTIVDDNSGWASYVGILLAAVITWGAWMIWNEKPVESETPTAAPAAADPPPAAEPPKQTG